jgi:hypothetical protein
MNVLRARVELLPTSSRAPSRGMAVRRIGGRTAAHSASRRGAGRRGDVECRLRRVAAGTAAFAERPLGDGLRQAYAGGRVPFYIKVRDAPGPWVCCTEEDFTIAIDPGLDITTGADLPIGNVGAAYGYQLATSTGGAASWSVTAGTLPSGIQLTADGAITGTPTQAVACSSR